MKILRLLNKKNLSIFIIFFFSLLNNLKAEEEPVDIWKLEKKSNEGTASALSEIDDTEEVSIGIETNNSKNTSLLISIG